MSDHWGTPDWIMALFDGWHDPCPPFGAQDTLRGYWNHPRVYVNPPYSSPAPWVAKAIRTASQGNTVAMLLKHDSSTQWYNQLKEAGARFLMIEGRLNYKSLADEGKTCHASPFPSVIAILAPIEAYTPPLEDYS